jgi:hypothetical protein
MRKEANVLDDVADHASQANNIPFASGTAFYQNFTGTRCKQAVDEFQGSGFSGATAAEKD